jgi:hypothetical protein
VKEKLAVLNYTVGKVKKILSCAEQLFGKEKKKSVIN